MTPLKTREMSGAAHINSKLLIINSLSGGMGHRLGRIMSCYDKVHWYSHPNNGYHPWEFASTDAVRESAFSKYHYDRILPDGKHLPLIGSRIEKYWDNKYWLENWYDLISVMDLPDGYLTYVVHDSPMYVRDRFPESIIINLIGDPMSATKRHMATSAKFRIDYAMDDQLPRYRSEWVKTRDRLLVSNPSATVEDLWIYSNGGTSEDYEAYVLASNRDANLRNIDESAFANITVEWDSFDPNSHVDLLGAIDERYAMLMPNG